MTQQNVMVSDANSNPPSVILDLEIEASRDGKLPPGGEEAIDKAETRRMTRSILHMMGIVDEQKFGKYLLGLAIPIGVTLVLSASSLVQTTEVRIVAVLLSAAIALTCNGLFLHENYPKISTWMLLSSAGLLMLSFFALIALFLPPYLKWIPVVCWLASLIPFAMSAWHYFRGD